MKHTIIMNTEFDEETHSNIAKSELLQSYLKQLDRPITFEVKYYSTNVINEIQSLLISVSNFHTDGPDFILLKKKGNLQKIKEFIM